MMALLNELAIQLYTLKDETAKDFRGSLRKVSEIGFTGVEFAGYGDVPADEMKALLKELNLTSVGSHVGIERLRNNFEEEMAYNKAIGTEYIIVPAYRMATDEEVNACIAELKELSVKVRAEGFKFGYHNHSFEFEKDGNGYFLDMLADAFTTEELVLELDVYWTAYAGVNHIEYMNKRADQVRLIHVKQISDYETKEDVEIDEGMINFTEVITLGKQNGVKHFVLERESFKTTPFESVANNFNYLMSL